MILTDIDSMPYGKNKGMQMCDVPASYLLYLNDENMTSPEVQEYIDCNWDRLESEVSYNQKGTQ